MALETRMSRRSRLSMTSLIDVIFLLLLFFMLSSTFSKYGDVELLAGGAARAPGDAPNLFLSIRPDGLLLNGQSVDAADLPARIDALREDGTAVALVSLAARTTSQGLVDVLAVLYGLPDLQVLVLE